MCCKSGGNIGRIFGKEKISQIMNGLPVSFSYGKVEHIHDYDVDDDGTLYALRSFLEADGSVRTELLSARSGERAEVFV